MRIRHSLPTHNCFVIMQPKRDNYTERCLLANKEVGELYELEDVNTGIITQAVLLDLYSYTLKDLPESLCYITYGNCKKVIRSALLERYPVLKRDRAEVEVLILLKK